MNQITLTLPPRKSENKKCKKGLRQMSPLSTQSDAGRAGRR